MASSIYLETSVIGAYLDKGESFRRDLTMRWWDHEMKNYRAYVSPLVVRELERTREPYRRSYLKLIGGLPQLEVTEEAAILADGYLARGIFRRKYLGDALHVALASFHKIDYLVTWNFGFMASVHQQARIRLFNTSAGFLSLALLRQSFWSASCKFHASLGVGGIFAESARLTLNYICTNVPAF